MTPGALVRALVVGVVLVVLSGCSEESPPGEKVPDLSQALERVDAAVESGDDAKARSAVEQLVSKTAQAQVAGEITGDESDRILEAAAAFLAALGDG